MSFEQEVADSLPDSFDLDGLSGVFDDPEQVFQILDKNDDGKITSEDLKLLLNQFGIKGIGAKLMAKLLFKKLDSNKNGTIEIQDLVGAKDIIATILKLKK